jgi:hypothetical protein
MPPQISPLRYAPVEMTIPFAYANSHSQDELSSRPEHSAVGSHDESLPLAGDGAIRTDHGCIGARAVGGNTLHMAAVFQTDFRRSGFDGKYPPD